MVYEISRPLGIMSHVHNRGGGVILNLLVSLKVSGEYSIKEAQSVYDRM